MPDLARRDDYGWSTGIGGLAVLDGASLLDRDGRVRIEAVREQFEPRLHLVPRFRQLLYRPQLGLGRPLWVDAPAFDLADHILVCPVAAPGGPAQLLQACQELAARRLDAARPPWELWLLPGLPDQRVGAYLRLHHAVADGTAALAVFGALLDLAPGAPVPAAPPCAPTPIPATGELLADNLRRRRAELGHGWSGLTHLSRTVRQAGQALPVWREVLIERPAPHTSLNDPVGAGRGFDARISTEFDVGLLDSACVYCRNRIGVCPTDALMFASEYHMRQTGDWDESRQTVTTTICPYCEVGCNLELHVQDDRIVKVTSPLDHNVAHGHLCVKGRFGFEFVQRRATES
jgi:ferredoxin